MLGGLTKALSAPIWGPRGLTLAASAIGYGVGHEAIRAQGDALRAYHGEAQYESQYATGIGMAHAGVTIGALYGGASAIFGRTLGHRAGGSARANVKRYATGGFAPLGTYKIGSMIGRGAMGAWSGAGKTMKGMMGVVGDFRNTRQINRRALKPRQRDLADLRSPLREGTRRRPAPSRSQRRQEIREQLRTRGAAKGGTLQERYAAEQARLQPGLDTAQAKYDAARKTFGGGAYHHLVNAPRNIAGAIAGGAGSVARGARSAYGATKSAGRYVAGGIAAGARRGAIGGAVLGSKAGPVMAQMGGATGLAGRALPAGGFFAGGLVGGVAAPVAMGLRGAGRGLMAGGMGAYKGAVAGGMGAYKGAAGMMPTPKQWNKVGQTLDPANWSKATMFKGGLGMVGLGGVGGIMSSEGQYHFPIMEAGNVSLAPSVTQRMNYSTVGLTQALHDKTQRRF